MTEEIKEILDDLKKYANEGGEHKLMEYEIKHIQCYITNLQQAIEIKNQRIKEEQQEKERYTKFYNDLNKWNKELQQENETLKEQNNDLRKIYRNTYKRLFENGNDELAYYFQAQIDDCPTFYVEPIIDYAKEYKIYKSRCEKAIEYIKKLSNKPNVFGHYGIDTECKKWLLKILKGK